jgi:5-methylcytosine-specific restriction endonuclease McrA
MNTILPKPKRIKLDREAYAQLCRQVLERDSWRCQLCGRPSQLQVHHLRFRSALGDDSLENLVTLCVYCHAGIHGLKSRGRKSRVRQEI